MCDDGNIANGDGCSNNCTTIDANYNCPIPGLPCVECGNGVIQPGEECDEGHLATPAKRYRGL